MSSPETRDELVTAIRQLEGSFQPIGRGSRDGWGAPTGTDTRISVAKLDRITRFDPDDLTCGVEPGVRLAELLATTEAKGLTLEAGPSPGTRSVGGLLGEAPPTSRGFDRGAWRSQLIGLTGVDGRGRVFKSGARVVKSVAGYDLGKLFVGSGGAYFAAAELQLRLTPLPDACVTLASGELPRADAGRLWAATRTRLIDARSLDLVVLPGGKARVECGLAGPKALVTALESQPGLTAVASGPTSWHRAGPQLEPGDDEVVVRGRLRPSCVADFVARLPDRASGTIHLQAAFQLMFAASDEVTMPGGTISRAIWNGPAQPPAGARVVHRLKQVFGDRCCPARSAFDASV